VKGPFDGSWWGASGGSACRIDDVSEDGCFIHTLAVPSPAEETVIKIQLSPAQTIELTGRVAYVERGMGFAVTFTAPSTETAEDFRRALDEIRAKPGRKH
jgi:hypothetical protein